MGQFASLRQLHHHNYLSVGRFRSHLQNSRICGTTLIPSTDSPPKIPPMGRFAVYRLLHRQKPHLYGTYCIPPVGSSPKYRFCGTRGGFTDKITSLWDALRHIGGFTAKNITSVGRFASNLRLHPQNSHLYGMLCVPLAASPPKISLLWDASHPTGVFAATKHTSVGRFTSNRRLRRQKSHFCGTLRVPIAASPPKSYC